MTVKQVCQEIHNLVEESGLHFCINQTPFSSYITLRKKFIKPEAGVYSDSENTDVFNPHLVSEQLQAQINSLSDLLAHNDFLCFGMFILLKFNICGDTGCDLLMLDVGSILGVVLECACRQPCSQGSLPGCG